MTILTKNFADMKARIEAHVAADEVVQDIYWDNGKGCFIGCLAHSHDPEISEIRFGLPIMVQRIAESIFEASAKADAKAFFAAIPDAVECDGKDLTRVGWGFLAEELSHLPEITDTTQRVIEGMKLLASGQNWPDCSKVADVARAAAYAVCAAREAALAAAADADRVAAACAAYAAADAAHVAYAPANARKRQRDTLLRLIKQAPVVKVPYDPHSI